MKTFISANPILSLIIIVGIIALIVYAIKKSKGQTNSPNNLDPSTPDNNNAKTKGINQGDIVWSGGLGSVNSLNTPSGTGMAGMMNNSRVAGSTNSPNNFANGGGSIVQRSVPSNAH